MLWGFSTNQDRCFFLPLPESHWITSREQQQQREMQNAELLLLQLHFSSLPVLLFLSSSPSKKDKDDFTIYFSSPRNALSLSRFSKKTEVVAEGEMAGEDKRKNKIKIWGRKKGERRSKTRGGVVEDVMEEEDGPERREMTNGCR